MDKTDQSTNYLLQTSIGKFFNFDVSEVSFNGVELYLNLVNKGRKIIEDISFNNEQAYNLVKHLADINGKAFNNMNPILDLSFGQFRLNAIHESIGNANNIGVTTFIIRQIYKGIRVNRAKDNLDEKLVSLFKAIITSKQSLIISGVTGSGKTEMQKYLVSLVDKHQRLIMIEDTYETHIKDLAPHLDINSWIINQNDQRSQISDLIRAGLRNNPDWLMLAESRGSETNELLLTVTSGIPIITTIHAQSSLSAIDRMIHLMGSTNKFNNQYLELEIASHIHFYIHMIKEVDTVNNIKRRIGEIMVSFRKGDFVIKKIIYNVRNKNFYSLLPKEIATLIDFPINWYEI
jgi:pilus assembly protein CpaF